MAIIKEFKEFISKGSVIDLAVGVVIGGAFKTIVDSLVANIIMPIIGIVTAGINFSEIKTVLKQAEGENPEVAIMWGSFLEAVISFLIIALIIFLMVKGINTLRANTAKLRKAEEKAEEAAAPASGPTNSELLSAILSELQKQNEQAKP